jgi:hypothetical protein
MHCSTPEGAGDRLDQRTVDVGRYGRTTWILQMMWQMQSADHLIIADMLRL